MIKLKKSLQIIICVAILAFFSIIHHMELKTYYDELLDSSGLRYEDFEKELRKENERAAENERDYRSMLTEEDDKADKNSEKDSSTKNLRLHSLSALLLDASNNRVLYEKKGYERMSMASTTKIMTCIVALENSKPEEVVTVSQYAARMPDVQLNINPNEQYYMKDLLYSLMLESHNDVAVAIAEHIGGSVEGFATMMNDKARSLGCEDTNFVTPNGLDAEGHYTTARDLAVIASYAIQNETFLEITNTSAHQFKEITKGKDLNVSNKNRFLYMMEGAIGVKTGFTNNAGYCFVGAVKRIDRTLISVVLGCGWPPSKSLKWRDTQELMNYGLESYNVRHIYEEKELDPIFVKSGQQKYEPVRVEKEEISLLMRDDETLNIEYEIPKILQAPVEKDRIVGYANYYINNEPLTKIPIYTTQDIKKINYPFCLKKLIELWGLQ